MPFEIMDQRGVSPSSHFFDEICFPEKQILKLKTLPDHHVETDGMLQTLGTNSVSSSLMRNLLPVGAQSVDYMELQRSFQARNQKEKLHVGGEDGTANLCKTSRRLMDHNLGTRSNFYVQPASYTMGGNRTDVNGTRYESSLFSNSLSDIFSRKLRLSASNVLLDQSAGSVASRYEEEEPFESLKEMEAQTIGNLLPDEDDLFSGVIDDLGSLSHANGDGDDFEDFDLFSSGGGMELEGDDSTCAGQRNSDMSGGISSSQGGSNGSVASEHPHGEHPSRTLFVRNINSNVEDSELKDLFEQYGDIRALYTACKHRGFVMISYYDIRAARNAIRALQNKPLKRRKLDIHYSIPKDNPSEKEVNQGTLVVFNLDSSVSNDDLRQKFSSYGEIKEIRETPQKHHHKFIEFYDVRAAEAALHALNKIDIAGKQIKLEASRPGGAKRGLMQPSSHEVEQDEPILCQSPNDNTSSGCMGMIMADNKFSPGGVASRGMENGFMHGPHSSIRVPAFIENGFPQESSSVPNTFPSPMRVASTGNQYGLGEPFHSLDQLSFGNQCVPPHSLPDYHDGLANGIPFNATSTVTGMTGNIGSRINEGIDNRHIRGVGSVGHPMELNGSVFGSSGNGSCPLHGHHYGWNNNSYQHHHPSSPMMWQNSPSFISGGHPHRPQQVPGFPRAPLHMMNPVSPAPVPHHHHHHHHVGSAPAVNAASLWDRRHGYPGDSPEASGFHMGFPGSSPLNSLEVASQNMFSHVGGNCVSPQHMCHVYPGRSHPMISGPSSFDSPNERVRFRRSEVNSNQGDKKQYELDIARILRGEDNRTTLMIKNIPNKYTSKMLLAAIDEQHRGTYDFIYLPIDFKNKCNVGYAFINMIDPLQIVPFHKVFNGKKWEKFNSEKVATLAYARIQGKAALIAHFQNSSLMNEDKRCRPILFHTDGPNAGDQEPFPMGTNIRSRPGKPRTYGNEEYQNHGNPSTFTNGEEGTDSSSGSGKGSF